MSKTIRALGAWARVALRKGLHYLPSWDLWDDLDEEQRALIEPIPPRFAPGQGYTEA